MRFGLIHRLMTDAIAVLGILALVTSGELGRRIGGAVLIGLAGALTVPTLSGLKKRAIPSLLIPAR